MHVGVNIAPQNYAGTRSDQEVFEEQIRIADFVVELGFDSIWATEHHFTGYIVSPDPLQLLSFVAGRHPKIQIGSDVVVLPWHNPLRVAEQVSLLDTLSGGRVILGLGRGAARVEFGGFGLDMGESRNRFVEYMEMLLRALERGYCEYNGDFVQQVRVDIRPRPFKSFKRRTYAAAVSPDSAPIFAKLGVGLMVIPQKPWGLVADDIALHRRVFQEVHGEEAPAPACGGFIYCDESADRAEEMARRHMMIYWESVLRHYEFRGDHFASIPGYEHYATKGDGSPISGANPSEDFVKLQVWGTPEQCIEKCLTIRSQIGFDTLCPNFSYGEMPYEAAVASLALFAQKVLPELRRL